MAREDLSKPRIASLRFIQDEAGGNSGGADGSDGNDGGASMIFGGLTVFPSVYDDGGVVKQVGYISNVFGPFVAMFAAAGFAPEAGFIVNEYGAAFPGKTLLTSTSVIGALPFGTAESNAMLTKDGVTNITRWLVRLGP